MSDIDLLLEEIEHLKGRLLHHGVSLKDGFRYQSNSANVAASHIWYAVDSIQRNVRSERLKSRNLDERTTVHKWKTTTIMFARSAWDKVKTKNGLSSSISVGPAKVEKWESYASIRVGHMWKFKVFDKGLSVADSLNGPVFVASATPKSSAFMREVGVDCYEAMVADSSKARLPETGFLFSWVSENGRVAFYHPDFKRGCGHVRNKIVGEIASLME